MLYLFDVTYMSQHWWIDVMSSGINKQIQLLQPSVCCFSQRRNVHPLDFRVKSNFSTVITSLDDAPNIWPSWHFCTRWYNHRGLHINMLTKV